jgi:lipopolysaccharide biosynthesis glycosyltransferase
MKQWRRESITAQVIRFIRDNPDKMYYHDQDGLNAVLHDKWLELDPRWNIQRNMLIRGNKELKRNAPLAEAIRKPSVIHFTGTPKPWHFHDNHTYKHQYYKYLAMTEWEHFRPSVGPQQILKKIARKLLPEFLNTLLINLKRSR